MLQEADSETRALGGTLDQPGNIGHHKAAMLTAVDYAQVRIQGGKGIVGHARPRRREGANQRRLAGIRQPEQADIGNDLEFQSQGALLTRQSRTELSRRAVGARLEAGVAPSTLAALRHFELLARAGQISERLIALGVAHHGARRHQYKEVLPAAPGAAIGRTAIAGL